MNKIIVTFLFTVILMSCKDQSSGLLSLEIEKSAKSIVEVAQWFDANKVVELPGNLANIKSITDNDNPVVVIAKLKK